jgi:WD40 repeat protein
MTANRPCPDEAMLNALLAGNLPEAEEKCLSQHLEECAHCREALDALGGTTSVREWRPRPITPPDEVLRRAMDALKGDPHRRSLPETAEDLLVGLLTPTDAPGLLGRLGPYEITGLVGRGGAGIVLKGYDPSLNRFVAIKVLAPHLASNVAARQRFAREARATAAVSHEHVVAIHGVDEANGLPYLVMEYVAGISLQERLDRAGALELEEVLRIGAQVASGLAAAHSQGLVHRDVKPGNILLESGIERVKITDFGLARAADDASVTQSGLVAGTPQYMAPEQARGEAVDYRADLFSLGSVLYAMCTGRPPFRASSSLAVLRRVCEEEPSPVRDANPEVPEWLAAIIATLHAKEPNDRFQSADEVANLLGRCLAHVRQPALVPAPRAGRFRLRRGWRTRRRVAVAAVLLAVSGLGLFGLAARSGLVGSWAARLVSAPADKVAAPSPLARQRASLVGLHGPVFGITFAPGSELLATAGDDGVVRLWDPVALHRPPVELPGDGDRLWAVAWSPNGKTLAAAGGNWDRPNDTGGIVIWDATTKTRRFELHAHTGLVFAVAFSPDSRTLASAGWDGTVRLWDVATGQRKAVLAGHTRPVRSLSFAPDGATLASGSFDGTVRLWDMATQNERRCLDTRPNWVNCVAFSPDGQILATAENPGEAVTAADSGVPIRPGQIRLWDAAAGRACRTLRGPRGVILTLGFSPDGQTLVSGGGFWNQFGEVNVWDVPAGGERLTLLGHKEWVECLTFSPDGSTLVSGGGIRNSRGEVKLWDFRPGPDVFRRLP